MNDLLEGARSLAKDFQNSELYKNYCRHKEALESDPLLLERVRAYKRSQFELESKRLRDGNVVFEEEKRVAHQYTELSLDPIAGAFLACEYELLGVYEEVLEIICAACEIE